jgi:hypothetical protein
MTPEQDRDKISVLFEDTGVHERAANILNAALAQLQARLCYTREEAKAAMRAHVSAPRKRRQRSEDAHA